MVMVVVDVTEAVLMVMVDVTEIETVDIKTYNMALNRVLDCKVKVVLCKIYTWRMSLSTVYKENLV